VQNPQKIKKEKSPKKAFFFFLLSLSQGKPSFLMHPRKN
jgi:hypothetical protein